MTSLQVTGRTGTVSESRSKEMTQKLDPLPLLDDTVPIFVAASLFESVEDMSEVLERINENNEENEQNE